MENRIKQIIEILDDKKAKEIEAINLTNKDYIADHVIIATTLNAKHAYALLGHLKDILKPLGEEFLRIETTDEWSVIDLGDIFIHLMNQNCREKYQPEDLLTTQYKI